MPQKSWVEGRRRLAEGGAVRPKAGRGGPEPAASSQGWGTPEPLRLGARSPIPGPGSRGWQWSSRRKRLEQLRSQRAGPSPRPSLRAPELSSLAAAAPRRSSGSLPARRRRQRRPRCCRSCGVAAQVPQESRSAAAARPAPGCSPAGDAGPRGGNFGFPPPSPLARGRRSTAAARPPASRARSHSRLAHGRPPHRPATHTALRAPRRCPSLLRAAPVRAATAPSHLVPAGRHGSRVSVPSAPARRCRGQGPRVGWCLTWETRRVEASDAEPRPRPAPRRPGRRALRALGAGQRARGGAGPGRLSH